MPSCSPIYRKTITNNSRFFLCCVSSAKRYQIFWLHGISLHCAIFCQNCVDYWPQLLSIFLYLRISTSIQQRTYVVSQIDRGASQKLYHLAGYIFVIGGFSAPSSPVNLANFSSGLDSKAPTSCSPLYQAPQVSDFHLWTLQAPGAFKSIKSSDSQPWKLFKITSSQVALLNFILLLMFWKRCGFVVRNISICQRQVKCLISEWLFILQQHISIWGSQAKK